MCEKTMVTRPLDKSEYSKWDEFVDSTRTGNIFAKSGWTMASANSLNTELEIIGTFDDERLVAGCPLFFTKRYKLLNFCNNTCGLMPYGGVIVEDITQGSIRKVEQRRSTILSSCIDALDRLNVSKTILHNPPTLKDIRSFIWRSWRSAVSYTYILELKDLHYSRSVRYSINKAKLDGVRVNKSSDIDMYYSLFQKTFEHQNLKAPVPKEYFKAIFEYISKNHLGELWISETIDGKWIAAEIFLHDNQYAHRWTATTDVELRKNGGDLLLLDEIFRHCQDNGIESMNLMAANTPQLTQFITGFNPSLVPYYILSKTKSLLHNIPL